jgi:YHS domain-containing protein
MLSTALLALAVLAAPGADKPAAAAKPATNTHCPVMGDKVNPAKSPKVVVRGQEYFLCCKGCDKKLTENPDKYLEQDGTPKNAKAKK